MQGAGEGAADVWGLLGDYLPRVRHAAGVGGRAGDWVRLVASVDWSECAMATATRKRRASQGGGTDEVRCDAYVRKNNQISAKLDRPETRVGRSYDFIEMPLQLISRVSGYADGADRGCVPAGFAIDDSTLRTFWPSRFASRSRIVAPDTGCLRSGANSASGART